jgi:hypothetical protein
VNTLASGFGDKARHHGTTNSQAGTLASMPLQTSQRVPTVAYKASFQQHGAVASQLSAMYTECLVGWINHLVHESRGRLHVCVLRGMTTDGWQSVCGCVGVLRVCCCWGGGSIELHSGQATHRPNFHKVVCDAAWWVCVVGAGPEDAQAAVRVTVRCSGHLDACCWDLARLHN